MAHKNSTTTKLFAICEPVVTGAGYELVDLSYLREQHGWVLRVFVDHPKGVGFDDCEAVSRELSAVLDVSDPLPQAYGLEVSSPGIDRPLRTAEHFRAQIGSVAKVVLAHGLDGRCNFKGELVAVEPDAVVVNVDGTQFHLPLADIDSAKLVPNWGEVLKQG
jgi:ribosome maturation factor RimP